MMYQHTSHFSLLFLFSLLPLLFSSPPVSALNTHDFNLFISQPEIDTYKHIHTISPIHDILTSFPTLDFTTLSSSTFQQYTLALFEGMMQNTWIVNSSDESESMEQLLWQEEVRGDQEFRKIHALLRLLFSSPSESESSAPLSYSLPLPSSPLEFFTLDTLIDPFSFSLLAKVYLTFHISRPDLSNIDLFKQRTTLLVNHIAPTLHFSTYIHSSSILSTIIHRYFQMQMSGIGELLQWMRGNQIEASWWHRTAASEERLQERKEYFSKLKENWETGEEGRKRLERGQKSLREIAKRFWNVSLLSTPLIPPYTGTTLLYTDPFINWQARDIMIKRENSDYMFSPGCYQVWKRLEDSIDGWNEYLQRWSSVSDAELDAPLPSGRLQPSLFQFQGRQAEISDLFKMEESWEGPSYEMWREKGKQCCKEMVDMLNSIITKSRDERELKKVDEKLREIAVWIGKHGDASEVIEQHHEL